MASKINFYLLTISVKRSLAHSLLDSLQLNERSLYKLSQLFCASTDLLLKRKSRQNDVLWAEGQLGGEGGGM